MSVDRARTMGLTGREIAEALANELDDTGIGESAPTRPHGAPVIGVDIPAYWVAFGEPREDQQ